MAPPADTPATFAAVPFTAALAGVDPTNFQAPPVSAGPRPEETTRGKVSAAVAAVDEGLVLGDFAAAAMPAGTTTPSATAPAASQTFADLRARRSIAR